MPAQPNLVQIYRNFAIYKIKHEQYIGRSVHTEFKEIKTFVGSLSKVQSNIDHILEKSPAYQHNKIDHVFGRYRGFIIYYREHSGYWINLGQGLAHKLYERITDVYMSIDKYLETDEEEWVTNI